MKEMSKKLFKVDLIFVVITMISLSFSILKGTAHDIFKLIDKIKSIDFSKINEKLHILNEFTDKISGGVNIVILLYLLVVLLYTCITLGMHILSQLVTLAVKSIKTRYNKITTFIAIILKVLVNIPGFLISMNVIQILLDILIVNANIIKYFTDFIIITVIATILYIIDVIYTLIKCICIPKLIIQKLSNKESNVQ